MTDEKRLSHTPGPWRVNKYGSIGAGEFGKKPIVANVEPLYGDDALLYGDSAANARLIAAAPDLLDALKELVAVVRGECPSLLEEDSGGSALLDMAIEDAIAKAEGRERG